MEKILTRAIEIVKSAYPIIMNETDTDSVTVKGDSDFVTQVDLKVQQHIKSELSDSFPQMQFMGEEGNRTEIDFSKPVWILDPIDGTTNLIHRYCMSAVSLALVENGKSVLGIVYNPFHNELFYAVKGGGAFLNGKPIHVSKTEKMRDALISIGTMPYDKSDSKEAFELYRRLFLSCVDLRRCGSAALDLCYIACGRTDAYFEPDLKPWDYAAGCIIAEEAGGVVTDYTQKAVSFEKNSSILAANKSIYPQIAEFFK